MSTGAKVVARLSGASESINATVRLPVSTAPPLVLSSGTLEALKWLALLLMALDHCWRRPKIDPPVAQIWIGADS